MSAGLPIFRLASVHLDGGVSTGSCNGGEDEANLRFESMRDSGDHLAIYLYARGGDGRPDLTKVIRAWGRPTVNHETSEWQEGFGFVED
jgi:hypothetical protein